MVNLAFVTYLEATPGLTRQQDDATSSSSSCSLLWFVLAAGELIYRHVGAPYWAGGGTVAWQYCSWSALLSPVYFLNKMNVDLAILMVND